MELDGLGEKFQSAGLFDERVTPDLGSATQVTENPVLSRSATTMALLDLRAELDPSERSWIKLDNTARVGSTRSRNSLDAEAGMRTGRDRFRIENQWDVQGGKDEPAAGSTGSVGGTWDHDSLLAGIRSQIRADAEWSRTTDTSLARIFDYRILRGQAQVRRSFGEDMELRALAGYRHKDAIHSPIGSYDETFAEAEGDGAPRRRDQLELLARAENRRYEADTIGIPSYQLYSLDARYNWRANDAFRPYTEQQVEVQNYRKGGSGIFQDSRGWKGEIGSDLFLSGLRRPDSTATLDVGTDWRFRLGARTEVFRVPNGGADSLSFASTFNSYGGILEIAREGDERLWADLTLEGGRRVYPHHANLPALVFENLNLSLSSSDFTYVRASLIGDWTVISWLHAEAFLEWDQELHDVQQDDFRLWIANVTLTHRF